jgi:hypothetical protein
MRALSKTWYLSFQYHAVMLLKNNEESFSRLTFVFNSNALVALNGLAALAVSLVSIRGSHETRTNFALCFKKDSFRTSYLGAGFCRGWWMRRRINSFN